MASPPPLASGTHLASLLQGLAGAGSPPGPSTPAGMNDPNGLLRMLAGGPSTPMVHSPPPPPLPQASSPASPGHPMSLLDLLNQRPSSQQQQQQRPSEHSPARSYGGEPSPSAARSDISQAGSPGGRLGGTSLMEMLMGGLPLVPPPSQRETLSPPPATSMNPLLSVQQQRSTRPNGYGLADTGYTSPSPPPSEAMALRIEPQSSADQAPAEPEPVEPQQPQPNPSMFSFVSPFDAAFGPSAGKRPKSVQPSSETAKTSSKPALLPASAAAASRVPRSTSFHGAPLPADGAAADSKLAPKLFPSAPSPPTPTPLSMAPVAPAVRMSSPQPPASPARSRSSNASAPIAADSPLGHTRTGSGSLRVKKGDVYPSGKWRAKTLQKAGLAGRAAEVPDRQRNAPVDISKPNLESLVADPAALAKRPISIIRSDLIYLPGRTVDGSTFIAYAMNKGRVRLIDEASGARALLKLPTEWYRRDAQVADLATLGGLVAAITTDGGLVIWRVPTSWTEDEPECALVFATGPADQEERRLTRLRWVSPTNIAVCSASAVWLVEFTLGSLGWTCDRPISLETLERRGCATRTAGRAIVDFAVRPVSSNGTQVAIAEADGSVGLHRSEMGQTHTFWHSHLTDDAPSSVEFLDSDLLLLGSKRGTVLRLVKVTARNVSGLLDEVRFETPDATAAFGKIEFDRRRDLVWLSNTARCSLYALRLDRESAAGSRPFFGRIVEFALDEPITSFVVKPTDTDAFVVSPNGVDMLTFSADVLDRLFQPTPTTVVPTPAAPESRPEIVKQEEAQTAPVAVAALPAPTPAPIAPEPTPEPTPRSQTNGTAPKAVKETAAAVSEGTLGRAVRKELALVEENLIRRFTASLQLQSERLETADLRRQEKIFAVLAQELGNNHSALVTEAVKTELHSAVLPALSTLVRAEVRSVIQQEVARSVAESISSRTVYLSIDKAVKDLAGKTLIPSFDGATAAMGAALTQEIREDMTAIRKEIVREQSGALVETNDLLSEMTSQIQALGKQVAELQGTVVSLQQQVVAIPQHPRQRSPVVAPVKPVETYASPPVHSQHAQHQHQQEPYPPPAGQAPPLFLSAPFGNPQQRSPLVQSMMVPPASLVYPQPIGPGPGGPDPFSPGGSRYSPAPVVDWGDAFTEAFLSADPAALAQLTRRIGPNLDAVLPDVAPGSRPAGPEIRGPLSQAVLLTTVHKFTESLPRAFANTADFASAVVVIARASRLLDTTDPAIVPYAHRVIAQVVPTLARTEAELAQAAAGAAGPPGSAGERTRLFFADGLRGARVELQSKLLK